MLSLLGKGLILAEGEEWRHQRRTIAPALAPRVIPMLARHVVSAAQEAIARLAGAASQPVDILAAFAGGNGMPVPTIEETPDHWREVIDTDLTSTFLTTSAILRTMVERGRGSIVTMSSAAGRQPAGPAPCGKGAAGPCSRRRRLKLPLRGTAFCGDS